MRVVFGSDFDEGAWPGPLAGREATAGEIWVETEYAGMEDGDTVAFFFEALRKPSAAHFYRLKPSDEADIATFLLGAFVDEDGDGALSAGDTLVGASDRIFKHLGTDFLDQSTYQFYIGLVGNAQLEFHDRPVTAVVGEASDFAIGNGMHRPIMVA